MKAAIVENYSAAPRYGEMAGPKTNGNEVVVRTSAAALSNFTRSRAAGTHYSSVQEFPFVPGDDGVGRLEDGQRVYFAVPGSRFGSMAEQVAVRRELCVPLPDDIDDVTAAAAGNPGMSSWVALTVRAGFVAGESVLIHGATGVSGRLAIQVAKYLGAGHVIATGRNPKALAELAELGADTVISLSQPEAGLHENLKHEIRSHKVNVVLDYLWGAPAQQIIDAISGHGSPRGEPRIRFVQIGALAGQSIALSAAALRSSGLEIVGSGLGSASAMQIVKAITALMQAIVPGRFVIPSESIPLSQVESAWNKAQREGRIVFTM